MPITIPTKNVSHIDSDEAGGLVIYFEPADEPNEPFQCVYVDNGVKVHIMPYGIVLEI